MTIRDLARFLLEQDDILVQGHIMPDGDSAGSVMALKLALEQKGKRACAYLPGGLPHMYDFLPHAGEFYGGTELPFQPGCAFSVDVSEEYRLGTNGGPFFRNAPCRAMLDHHGTNPGFGDVYFIDGNRAACGELALELIRELGAELTREMAEWLFVAISTDTGNMNFENTRPETLLAAAECLRAGAEAAPLTKKLYRTRTAGRTKLLGVALSNLELSFGGRVATAGLQLSMFEDAGAERADTEGIVNYLQEIEGVDVAILAVERGEQLTKLSLRSNAPYDVAKGIAAHFGGGGHSRAAGCEIALP